MAELAVSIEIDASPAAVWAAVVDWEAQSEWVPLTRVRGTAGGGHGVGGRVEAFTGVGRIGFADPMEVTAWDPPRRCAVRHLGRVVRGTAVFEVDPRPDGGATFHWVEWLELPFGRLGVIAWPLVRPMVALPLALSLRRLKRRLECRRD